MIENRQSGAAARRGTLIHALLERLPQIAGEDRDGKARAWLERQAGDLAPAEREEMLARATQVLAEPAFAEVFGPRALAEVPLAATVEGQVVMGTADRLLVTADTVTVVDFKTARRPPLSPDAVAHRLPLIQNAKIDYHRVGLVSYSIDFLPNIGPVAALPGLYLGTNFCSGGFGHTPMAGLLLAEYILDGQTTFDGSDFDPDRFKDFDTRGYLAQDITHHDMVEAHATQTKGFVRKKH